MVTRTVADSKRRYPFQWRVSDSVPNRLIDSDGYAIAMAKSASHAEMIVESSTELTRNPLPWRTRGHSVTDAQGNSISMALDATHAELIVAAANSNMTLAATPSTIPHPLPWDRDKKNRHAVIDANGDLIFGVAWECEGQKAVAAANALMQHPEKQVACCADGAGLNRKPLDEYLVGRRKAIEASIAAEVMAGNKWKEECERCALAEITALECRVGNGRVADSVPRMTVTTCSDFKDWWKHQDLDEIPVSAFKIAEIAWNASRACCDVLVWHDTVKEPPPNRAVLVMPEIGTCYCGDGRGGIRWAELPKRKP